MKFINLIRKLIERNGIRMLFIYNLTIYCIFLTSGDDCWNYKGKVKVLEEEEEKKLFIARRLSVTMSIELLLCYYCCFFSKYKSKFECMNTFLQHFSNCNLTNQSIVIYRFYILHQKIYGTNINNTN